MSADRPTLHLTNLSSTGLHGPGRLLGIMARPRSWEAKHPNVPALTPDPRELDDVRLGRLDVDDYLRRFVAKMRTAYRQSGGFGPGRLVDAHGRAVEDGDTLFCSCSREAASEGRCHRVPAARALAACGWRVVLDGVEADGQ